MAIIERKLPNGGDHISIDGYTKEILDFYHKAVHDHNTSAVFIFDGKSGYGKTTLNNQIGIYLDPDYGLHKMFYTPEEFLEGLKNAKKGDYICFDEAMILSNRSALSQLNRMIIIAMSMIRSKNIFVSFCVNAIFDLDRNLAISRADMLFHVYGDNLIDRGKYGTFFRAKDGKDRLKDLYLLGKKFYSYKEPAANYVASFSKEFVVDDVEYERRKQIGITKFLTGSEKTAGRKKDEVIKRAIAELSKAGHNQTQIGEMVGLSHQRVSQILGETPISASSSI